MQTSMFVKCKMLVCSLFYTDSFMLLFITTRTDISQSQTSCHCSESRGVTNNVNECSILFWSACSFVSELACQQGPGTPKWNAAISNVIIKILPKCPLWENLLTLLLWSFTYKLLVFYLTDLSDLFYWSVPEVPWSNAVTGVIIT